MSWAQDFKKFIQRGNPIDVAIGVMLGAAFANVTDTFVKHILMPPVGFLLGGVDFSHFKIELQTGGGPVVAIHYGLFLASLLNFLLVAFSVFLLLKILGSFYRKREFLNPKEPCPICRMEIPIRAQRCGHCTTDLSRKE